MQVSLLRVRDLLFKGIWNLGFNLGFSLQRHKAGTKVPVPKKMLNLMVLKGTQVGFQII